MPYVRITENFTFHPPGRAAITLEAGELFLASAELAEQWRDEGRCQGENEPWPRCEERRPPILGPDGSLLNGGVE